MPSLTWLTRDDDLKRAAAVPYRLLEADPALSHGDPAAGNMLIRGDNLDARDWIAAICPQPAQLGV